MTERQPSPDQSSAARIPLVDEEARVVKREVETGRVRVRTVVDERQEWIREAVSREDVEVERVAVGREVEAAPPVRQEGDTVIIPIVEEIVVVEKRLVLREEIRLHRRTSIEPVEQPVTLRSTRAVVERTGQEPSSPTHASKE